MVANLQTADVSLRRLYIFLNTTLFTAVFDAVVWYLRECLALFDVKSTHVSTGATVSIVTHPSSAVSRVTVFTSDPTLPAGSSTAVTDTLTDVALSLQRRLNPCTPHGSPESSRHSSCAGNGEWRCKWFWNSHQRRVCGGSLAGRSRFSRQISIFAFRVWGGEVGWVGKTYTARAPRSSWQNLDT